MALTIPEISAKTQRLRAKFAARDARMNDVLLVRSGEADQVHPGLFPEAWPKPIVANFCDVAARDLAELIAPLPAFNCSSAGMVSDVARKFADKRTKVGAYYLLHSDLATQMFRGADLYLSYGFVSFIVEPDFDAQCPRIRVDESIGAYPEFDRWGEVVSYTRRFTKPLGDLIIEYPDYASVLTQNGMITESNAMIEVIRYVDADQDVMFIPSRDNLTLGQVPNLLGRCPVVVAQRPALDKEMRGQFDDVLWVQIARAKMALYGMEAAQKSVQGPMALPDDVQEITFGADAVLRSRTPEKIRRVGVELPQGAFVESQMLDQEMRVGARYPGVRSGVPEASVITGRGIQELSAGFDSQVKTAQEILVPTFRRIMRLAFEMDEKLWGDVTKTIRGNVSGTPFEVSYTPSKAIAGDHTIDVTFGFLAGMDPNRAVVFLLQLRGDHLISKDFTQRQLPINIDITEEQQRIDIEETREAIKQGVYAMAQAIPALAEQGQDPSPILVKMAEVIHGRQKGDSIEDVVARAFAPQPPPEASSPDGAAPPGGVGPGGSAPGGAMPPPGMNPSGLMQGVAPGQAGMAPGGRPAMQDLLAGLSRGGSPVLSASVARRLPA